MASAEDEQSLRASLELYEGQLLQVEASLQSNDSVAIQEDLRQLQNDLKEIIRLTQDTIENKRLRSREHSSQNAAFPDSSQYFDNQVSSSIDSEFSSISNNYGNNADSILDEEYAAFQNLLGEHLTKEDSTEGPEQMPENKDSITEDSDQSAEEVEEGGDEGDYDTSGEDDEGREFSGDSSQDDDMFGQKCQAPFCHSWGRISYHNAIILSRVQNDSTTHEAEVEVFCCNPTHISMQPCPYYLTGCCRFDSTACKYSHGEHVKISDLRPFRHPDFSNLALDTKCLARDDDDIWYEAVIVEILEDSHFQIQFEANNQLKTVSIKDIFPIECQTDDTSSPAIDDDDPNSQEYTGTSLPSLLTEMPDLKTTDALGRWEMHTKGIGSKLMAKMGYVVGQGLGRNNEGRAEPVPINLLPKGITLDKIMELKSMANNDDLFNAMKKQKRKNKQQNHKKSEATNNHKTSSPSVFNFINSKLHQSKGPDKSSVKCRTLRTAKDTKFISAHELKDKSDKHLNIQLLKTNEEIKNTERQIRRLQDSLERAVER